MKSFHLPYKFYNGEFYPIIKIKLKGPQGIFDAEAYVDSGASTSIFMAEFASVLGIDYTRGQVSYTMVGDGSFIPFYVHRVPLQIGNVWVKAAIGFSSRLGAEFNLLGQKDIFDRFKVTFDKRNKRVSFQSY